MSRGKTGHTLIELLVASVLLGLVLTTLLGTWSMLQRASETQQARREARQQARTLLTTLSSDVQHAVLIWTGPNTVDGHLYQVPAPAPAPPPSGTDLLYAMPEIGAGGLVTAGSLTYTVVGVYSRAMSPPDSLNPDVDDVVYERFGGVMAARPDEPATIDLSRLSRTSSQWSEHVYHPYLPASNWLAVLSPPRGVYLDLTFLRVPPHGPVQTEHLTTEAVMRDGY